eukprot:Skav222137  [mRNA]  locus=scaffold1181:1035199:1036605:- [translate_table: standard]
MAALRFLATASPSLRGDVYVDTVQCTGSGTLPKEQVCFSGSILLQTFDIEVLSYDGTLGSLQAVRQGRHREPQGMARQPMTSREAKSYHVGSMAPNFWIRAEGTQEAQCDGAEFENQDPAGPAGATGWTGAA